MTDPLRILGLHDNHNSSVALLEDGEIVFAVQEERLTRVKNTTAFPTQAVQAALDWAGIGPSELDGVAFASRHNPKRVSKGGLLASYRGAGRRPVALGLQMAKRSPLYWGYQRVSKRERLRALERHHLPLSRVEFVDHHLCHASAAYYASHYGREERVLVLTLDGGGDGLCATVSVGEDGRLRRLAATPEGHSIGNLYALTTFFLGFTPWEHEYKLMGMAPYVAPQYAERLQADLARLLRVEGLRFRRSGAVSTMYALRALRRIYERARFDNIAAAIQGLTERLTLQWVRNAIQATGIHRLACGGGVFMNVKTNQRIGALPEVEDLFVMPSCGDESNSIGAAFHAFADRLFDEGTSDAFPAPLENLYLGPDFDPGPLVDTLAPDRFSVERLNSPAQTVAELLADGVIVGRVEGRLEFGARALGNRSILARGDNLGVTQRLNAAVKLRDFWMPFAPSILAGASDRYLVNPKGLRAPHMMLTFPTTEAREDMVAAIHPADETTRPQVVEREHNPPYHALLERFHDLTGFGALLNTSFNIHGEPIVNGPSEALSTLGRSGLTHVLLGGYLIEDASPGPQGIHDAGADLALSARAQA